MNNSIILFKRVTPVELRIFLRKIRWKLTYYLQSLKADNSGKKYCPVNEKNYSHFAKIGNQLVSPDLGARERHRFIWHYMNNHTDVINSCKNLLHISPEYCFYKKFEEKVRQNYFPVDKFEPGYDYLKKTEDFDLLQIKPEDKGKYSFIICNHVLEHIEDDSTAISNLYNLMEKDGIAIVSVPIRNDGKSTLEDPKAKTAKERKKIYGQWDHVRYYGLDIVEKFENAGFKVEVIDTHEYFSTEEREKFGIQRQDYMFVLTK